MIDSEPLRELRQLVPSGRRVTLYLGAGVSCDSGIPTWQRLVATMLFAAVRREESIEDLGAHPSYLFAVADWHLARVGDPPEIAGRKLRRHYEEAGDEAGFMRRLKRTLYQRFYERGAEEPTLPGPDELLQENSTLRAAVKLCRPHQRHPWRGRRAARAVVTYNYDNILETVLAPRTGNFRPVWKPDQQVDVQRCLPIYHVHGYVPAQGNGSDRGEIIFAEEQYQRAAHDPHCWFNLTQIQALSASTCVMMGLSLTDPNMRRLLEAIRNLPERRQHYAFLQRPKREPPQDQDFQRIQDAAQTHLRQFKRHDGALPEWPLDQLRQVVAEVEAFDRTQQERVLHELGVKPIWYDDHTEIERAVEELFA